MAVRKAHASWEGTLKEGKGTIKLGSGAYEGQYNFSSRFEEGTGTNPEELLGAAHAGCFTMKLNNMLHGEGHPPTKIDTTAHVSLGKIGEAVGINKITLEVIGTVPGITQEQFEAYAKEAHDGCIISIALGNVPEVVVDAKLV